MTAHFVNFPFIYSVYVQKIVRIHLIAGWLGSRLKTLFITLNRAI